MVEKAAAAAAAAAMNWRPLKKLVFRTAGEKLPKVNSTTGTSRPPETDIHP